MKSAVEPLVDALDRLELRMRCGHTLSEAARDLPSLHVPASLCRRWTALRERILAGTLPGADSIASWTRCLRAVTRIESQVARRTALPRIQSRVLIGLVGLVGIATKLLLPSSLAPGVAECALAALFCGAGFYWMRIIETAFRRALWPARWVEVLFHLSAGAACGRTLGPSLADLLQDDALEGLPPALRAYVEAGFESCRLREPPPAAPAVTDAGVRDALDQAAAIFTTEAAGHPLAELLDRLAKARVERFEDALVTQAEQLSVKMMAPLFATFAPALLVLVAGPAVKALALGF